MSKNITTKSFLPLDKNPIRQFARWFREAKQHPQIKLPEAACLATIGLDGFPNSRMILLKGFDEQGFVFYTNLNSLKARSLRKTPKASLTFYWEPLHWQVRIEGSVKLVLPTEADHYFQSRPRLSQLAAWASDQSAPLKKRSDLIRRFREFQKKFEGQEVPRPSFWNGFRIKPLKMEFWIERPNRLHDRLLYSKTTKGWMIKRLYP